MSNNICTQIRIEIKDEKGNIIIPAHQDDLDTAIYSFSNQPNQVINGFISMLNHQSQLDKKIKDCKRIIIIVKFLVDVLSPSVTGPVICFGGLGHLQFSNEKKEKCQSVNTCLTSVNIENQTNQQVSHRVAVLTYEGHLTDKFEMEDSNVDFCASFMIGRRLLTGDFLLLR